MSGCCRPRSSGAPAKKAPEACLEGPRRIRLEGSDKSAALIATNPQAYSSHTATIHPMGTKAIQPEIGRIALDALCEAATDTPVVAINGARQVGKSTLARQFMEQTGGQLVTLDDLPQRTAANSDPRSFVERHIDGPLIIDEVQFAPPLFRALKAAVDRDRRPGRFILTGSTRLLSAQGFADALVGRIEIIELWPFSQGELSGVVDSFINQIFDDHSPDLKPSPLVRSDYIERMMRGGFPEPNARQSHRRKAWFDGYLTSLTEKLIRDVSDIERIADMPRIIRLCAARSGQELNITNLANDLGMPPRTLDGYLALLSNLFVIQLIPAWSTNLSKKVIRRPKLVVVDSGLAAHLTGMTVDRSMDPTTPLGPLLESFVAMEIRKQLSWSSHGATCWHFRDRDGAEVDFILEHPDGRVIGIETKAAAVVSSRDTRGLRFLADRLGNRFHAGYVLSMMPEAIPLGPKLTALPIDSLWTSNQSVSKQP